MSYENVVDLDCFRVERAIRRLDADAEQEACLEMRASTDALIAVWNGKDGFAITRAIERCDAARLRLLMLMETQL